MKKAMCVFRKTEDLKDVWAENYTEDELVYVVFRRLESNITVLLPGKVGKEFHKTHGHYHLNKEKETYRVIYGKGLLLIQKEPTELDKDNDFKAVELSQGDEFVVPEGYGHALVNPTEDFFITEDRDSIPGGHNYEPIKNMRGFAKYVVEEGGKVIFVDNVHYNQRNN